MGRNQNIDINQLKKEKNVWFYNTAKWELMVEHNTVHYDDLLCISGKVENQEF